MIAVELLPERNCGRCTAAQKVQWGCTADAKLPIELEGEKMLRCPRRPILDDPAFYGEVFGLYRNFQKGFLYDEGSLGSQPAVVVDCFQVLEQTLGLVDDYRQEQAAKKKARGNKR